MLGLASRLNVEIFGLELEILNSDAIPMHAMVTNLLLKISPFFLIDKNKVEIISYGEFLVDIAHRWC